MINKNKEYDSGHFIGHYACIADEIEHKDGCGSSDALAIYEHDNEDGTVWYDAKCYSCGQLFNKDEVHNSSVAIELGIKEGEVVENKKFKRKPKSPPLNMQQVKSLIKSIGYKSNDYRGIKDEYSKFYGHLTKLDGKGKVLSRYYPETEEGKVVGYKCRNHPKDFRYGKLGRTGNRSDLSGQVKFKSGDKYLLIVGGEEDKVAAFQMLRESQVQRGQKDYGPIAVVSPTSGEGSAPKQVASQYDFCDMFDIIIVGLDNDEAGQSAAKEVAKILPSEKVRIAKWSGKDPNKMLLDGKEKQFVKDFYGAKEFVPTDIKHSSDALEEVKDFLLSPKVPLPPYLHRLQEATRGGIKTSGAIINLIGDTSIGKSLFTDSLLYYWFFESPIVPTIISLERTTGELTADFISMHLKKNLAWFKNGEDAISLLEDPKNEVMIQDLLVNDIGEDRYHVLDERSGDMKTLIAVTERAIKQYGSRMIIFDPLTDFLRSLGTEAQEEFMMWEKRKKKDGVIFFNVLHTRKPMPDKDGKIRPVTEYDALGSGTFVQSSDMNWVINRDKMSKDPILQNTTRLDAPKIRGGSTGHICDIYYEGATRTLHDFEDHFQGEVSEPVQEPLDDELQEPEF